MQSPPENVKDYPVTSDTKLTKEEKETDICLPNDLERGTIFTEVPTVMKWIFSVNETEVSGVRMNDSNEIIAVEARIPKGIIKFQRNSRKSNSHSQMVSYGDLK
jgi:hypothetical protein